MTWYKSRIVLKLVSKISNIPVLISETTRRARVDNTRVVSLTLHYLYKTFKKSMNLFRACDPAFVQSIYGRYPLNALFFLTPE
jgi:hypothetical protein